MILPNRPHCKDPEAKSILKNTWWAGWYKNYHYLSHMMTRCYSIRKEENGIWMEKAHWFGELQNIRLFKSH